MTEDRDNGEDPRNCELRLRSMDDKSGELMIPRDQVDRLV